MFSMFLKSSRVPLPRSWGDRVRILVFSNFSGTLTKLKCDNAQVQKAVNVNQFTFVPNSFSADFMYVFFYSEVFYSSRHNKLISSVEIKT